METAIALIQYVRKSILQQVERFTTEQLNQIPAGFNNNLVWNLGHLLITQQQLCYKLGGFDMTVPADDFAAYSWNTRPDGYVSSPEVERIKALLLMSINQFEKDVTEGKFESYTPWVLPSGIAVNDISDALKVCMVHEGRHFGGVIALSKVII